MNVVWWRDALDGSGAAAGEGCGICARHEIIVPEGKGFKDRVTMLPESIVATLRAHLVKVCCGVRIECQVNLHWSAHDGLYLPPAASAGLSVLVAHDQDSNATFEISIYDRIWEDL